MQVSRNRTNLESAHNSNIFQFQFMKEKFMMSYDGTRERDRLGTTGSQAFCVQIFIKMAVFCLCLCRMLPDEKSDFRKGHF